MRMEFQRLASRGGSVPAALSSAVGAGLALLTSLMLAWPPGSGSAARAVGPPGPGDRKSPGFSVRSCYHIFTVRF